MKEPKWPWIKWFVNDWLADPKVSRCQPATRGIWFDWLLSMHATDRSGQITGTREILAVIGRCTVRHVDEALQDLTNTNAAEVTRRNGNVTVINRRMKREYLARKSTRFRVQRHRARDDVTPNSQSHIPEPKKHRQPSQCQLPEQRMELTKLTKDKLTEVSLRRIARDITTNKTGWAYDNCKVKPEMFPWVKSLVTVMSKFADKIQEAEIHQAWNEAVKRTHAASVDGLAKDPARYVIECWKEAMSVGCGGRSLAGGKTAR